MADANGVFQALFDADSQIRLKSVAATSTHTGTSGDFNGILSSIYDSSDNTLRVVYVT